MQQQQQHGVRGRGGGWDVKKRRVMDRKRISQREIKSLRMTLIQGKPGKRDMGTTQSILDIDDGQGGRPVGAIHDTDNHAGIHDWMHENFFFKDPRWKVFFSAELALGHPEMPSQAMKRQLRRRVSRCGGWKGVSNKWGEESFLP
eukprot:768682-Hanusia_phi.AAC.5